MARGWARELSRLPRASRVPPAKEIPSYPPAEIQDARVTGKTLAEGGQSFASSLADRGWKFHFLRLPCRETRWRKALTVEAQGRTPRWAILLKIAQQHRASRATIEPDEGTPTASSQMPVWLDGSGAQAWSPVIDRRQSPAPAESPGTGASAMSGPTREGTPASQSASPRRRCSLVAQSSPRQRTD